MAMIGSGSTTQHDYNGDLIKIDGSISPPGSVETTSPGEIELALPEEQKSVKRKGGRKPIYATTEERKQRNREAQAAFRERRNEYIKKLQKELDEQKAELELSQQNHRTAADECLVLRYKCSLLEKIMSEKGIDSESELRVLADNPAPSAYIGGPRPPGQRSGYRTILSRPTEAQRAAAGLLPARQDSASIDLEPEQKKMVLSSPTAAIASTSQTPSPPTSPTVLHPGVFHSVKSRPQDLARALHQQPSQVTEIEDRRMHRQLQQRVRQDNFNSAPPMHGNRTRIERRGGSAEASTGQSKASLLSHLPYSHHHRTSKEDTDEPLQSEVICTAESSSPLQKIGRGRGAPSSQNAQMALDGSRPPQLSTINHSHEPHLPFQHTATTSVPYAQPFRPDILPGQVNSMNQYSAIPHTHPQARLASAHASYVNSTNNFENQNEMYLPMDAPMHGDPYTLHNNLEYNAQYNQQCAYGRR